jgi:peptidoglycan/LPS O-acetylase OafA/YrhL
MKNQASSTSPLYITRFFAAYGVLLFHFLPKQYYDADTSLIARLGEAVNYFFFISGFVMIIASKKYLVNNDTLSKFSSREFWIKRVARIYPLYILALLLCIFFNYAVVKYDPSIPYRSPLEILGIQRWIYAGSINFPAWSVSCEFFFYFLFPLLLPFMMKLPVKRLALYCAIFLVINAVFTFLWASYVVPAANTPVTKIIAASVYNHPIFKLSVFLAGNLLGLIYIRYEDVINKYQKVMPVIALSGLAAIIYILVTLHKDNYLIQAGLLVPLYFIFVLALCSMPVRIAELFNNRLFIFLGEISYGVYILQAPVLLYFEYYMNGGEKLSDIGGFMLYTATVVILAGILYYIFERPARDYIIELSKRKKRRPFLLAILFRR